MSDDRPPADRPVAVGLDAAVARIVSGVALSDRDVEQRMYEQATLASARYALDHMVTARPVREEKYKGAGSFDMIEHALTLAPDTGFYAEFGVCRGATLKFIAERIDRVIYGFDSFEGLPEDWSSRVRKGAFTLHGAVPEIAVVNRNFRLVKGWFSETLPTFTAQVAGPAAFLHLDCFLYSGTRDVLDGLADRIVAGTVIVFSEYMNYPGWQVQQFRAFQEFCARHACAYRYAAFTTRGTGVTVVME